MNFSVKVIIFVHTLWAIAVLSCLPLALIYPHLHKSILWFLGLTLVAGIPYGTCPFTYMENKMRTAGKYSDTFMRHYLNKLFGWKLSDVQLRWANAIFFTVTILIAIFYKLHQAF